MRQRFLYCLVYIIEIHVHFLSWEPSASCLRITILLTTCPEEVKFTLNCVGKGWSLANPTRFLLYFVNTLFRFLASVIISSVNMRHFNIYLHFDECNCLEQFFSKLSTNVDNIKKSVVGINRKININSNFYVISVDTR